jgi:hypothetical protein
MQSLRRTPPLSELSLLAGRPRDLCRARNQATCWPQDDVAVGVDPNRDSMRWVVHGI